MGYFGSDLGKTWNGTRDCSLSAESEISYNGMLAQNRSAGI